MPRITNAQLAAQLEAAHVAYERQATQLAEVRAECDALRAALHEAEAEVLSMQRKSARTQRTQATGPGLSNYAQACAAARELAMRTGRCIRVGG